MRSTMVLYLRRAPKKRPSTAAKEVSSAMSIMKRARQRRQMHLRNRAIERAMQAAPTQAMRDEIAIIAQRQPV
jgi:hypothetical protein